MASVARVRAARDDGDRRVAPRRRVPREVLARVDRLGRRERPVLEEDALQLARRPGPRCAGARRATRRRRVICPPLYSSPMLKPPVNAVSPSTTTILRWLRRFTGWRRTLRIGRNTPTCAPAFFSGRRHERPEREAAEAVDEQPHLDAPLRRGDEALAEPRARGVVANEVVLRVHVVLRAVDRGADGVVGGPALGEHVDLVAARRALVRQVRADAEQGALERGLGRVERLLRSAAVRLLLARPRTRARGRSRRARACASRASARGRGRRAGTGWRRPPAGRRGRGSRRSSTMAPCAGRARAERAPARRPRRTPSRRAPPCGQMRWSSSQTMRGPSIGERGRAAWGACRW